MWYTVVYTSSNRWGTIVHSPLHVEVPSGSTLYKELTRLGIDTGAIAVVFYGRVDPILSDFSKL